MSDNLTPDVQAAMWRLNNKWADDLHECQQSLYNERQTSAARETQVREALKGLLVKEPTEAEIWDPSPAGAAQAAKDKARNEDVRAAAKTLGIDL